MQQVKTMIPRDLIVPIIDAAITVRGRGGDMWTTSECEQIKKQCGPGFAHIPCDDIRDQIINLRKGNRLRKGTSGGHGAGKSPELSPEYRQYLDSPEWATYIARLKEAWGHRCAICNASKPLQGHHRTYANLGNENPTDCIPVCCHCHKFADRRRRLAASNGTCTGLFDE